MFRFIVWPNQSIMQKPEKQVPRIDMTPVLEGRELSNVIRVNIEKYSLDNPEKTVKQAILSADARFTPDGHNVIIVNNNKLPLRDILLGTTDKEYLTALRAGFPGWETLRPWFDSIIDAIDGAGHRIDAIHFNIESVSGWWWSTLPSGSAAKSVIVAAYADDPTGLPEVDQTQLPKYAGRADELYYATVTKFNRQLWGSHCERVLSVFGDRIKKINPAVEMSMYGAAEYSTPYRVPGNSAVEMDLTLDGISSPNLYYGLEDAKARLASITGPHIPWMTPTTGAGVTQEEADEFAYIINAAEAAGLTQGLIWGSLGDTYPIPPAPPTPPPAPPEATPDKTDTTIEVAINCSKDSLLAKLFADSPININLTAREKDS